MRAAQRLLEDEPWLPAWAELAVLGHLTGWPIPAVRAPRLRFLLDLPARLRECALSHAVDGAVAARSTVLSRSAGPAELAAHVLDGIEGHLVGAMRCAEEEPAYLARPYRWARVADILATARRTDPAAPRHPRTAEWAERHRREIPGETVGEQAAAVQGWLEADVADDAIRRTVALGLPEPGALERAVGSAHGSADWTPRLTALLAENFAACRWPYRLLTAESV
jgi:hypothetical protein